MASVGSIIICLFSNVSSNPIYGAALFIGITTAAISFAMACVYGSPFDKENPKCDFPNAFLSINPANHVHTYAKTVTEPTATSMGYTTYTCTGCGYFYQDDFVSKLTPDEPSAPTHIHSYTGTTVLPTGTEQGYTLFVCDLCGDSYKANYTPATGA